MATHAAVNERPPAVYLGQPVPEHIAAVWRTWAGAEWRKMAYCAGNRVSPPDQRFSVRPPGGMCELHLGFWRRERDRRFDLVSGNRWPGSPGSPFTIIDHDLGRERERRRAEWDEKASGQMQLTEEICLSGKSPQCEGERTCTDCRLLACRCGNADQAGYYKGQVVQRLAALSVEEQVESLQQAYDQACADTIGDQGEEIVDRGGWAEIARAVADLAGPEVSRQARHEFLRCQGLALRSVLPAATVRTCALHALQVELEASDQNGQL